MATGRKPSNEVRKCTKNDLLQRQNFQSMGGGDDEGTTRQIIKLVVLANTLAFKCYGYYGYLRESAQDPCPPPSNNIVLHTVLHKVYRERGSMKRRTVKPLYSGHTL